MSYYEGVWAWDVGVVGAGQGQDEKVDRIGKGWMAQENWQVQLVCNIWAAEDICLSGKLVRNHFLK